MKQPDQSIPEFDREIFDWHNKVRSNPSSIVPELEKHAANFTKELYLNRSDGRPTLQTKEGIVAVKEAIAILKAFKPCNALNWNSNIANACRDHVNDIGPKGLVGHASSENPQIKAKHRMRKYGNVISCYGENMSFSCLSPIEVMI